MDHTKTIQELSRNRDVFKVLLTGLKEEDYTWKPQPDKWCLLEIVCHLHDEEREDFRARTKQILESPEKPLPSIDPQGWVLERGYMQQNFSDTLNKFLRERERSIDWLESLTQPKWDNAYHHPKLGAMTAQLFLVNWLAHDYLHIRQIAKLKYENLKYRTGETVAYAGNW